MQTESRSRAGPYVSAGVQVTGLMKASKYVRSSPVSSMPAWWQRGNVSSDPKFEIYFDLFWSKC